MTAFDVFGNEIELWDILFVVSASGELQLALVVDFSTYGNPIVVRYNTADGTLRNRRHVFADRWERYVVPLSSVPGKYLMSRRALMDEDNR